MVPADQQGSRIWLSVAPAGMEDLLGRGREVGDLRYSGSSREGRLELSGAEEAGTGVGS